MSIKFLLACPTRTSFDNVLVEFCLRVSCRTADGNDTQGAWLTNNDTRQFFDLCRICRRATAEQAPKEKSVKYTATNLQNCSALEHIAPTPAPNRRHCRTIVRNNSCDHDRNPNYTIAKPSVTFLWEQYSAAKTTARDRKTIAPRERAPLEQPARQEPLVAEQRKNKKKKIVGRSCRTPRTAIESSSAPR